MQSFISPRAMPKRISWDELLMYTADLNTASTS
jgi:hypothetical protein